MKVAARLCMRILVLIRPAIDVDDRVYVLTLSEQISHTIVELTLALIV